MTREERKERSVALLKEHGVPYIDHLPYIETAQEVTPRTAEEIAKRALACLFTVQVACDICAEKDVDGSREFFKEMLITFGAADALTEKERVIFFGEPSRQDAVNMAWKYEAYWPLIWALGLIDTLEYPSQICDCDVAIDVVRSCETFEEFMESTNLRGIEEVLDEADLIFRYDWACVDARVNGRETPAELDAGVVMERHWGLNWLIGKNTDNDQWDSVSTNT